MFSYAAATPICGFFLCTMFCFCLGGMLYCKCPNKAAMSHVCVGDGACFDVGRQLVFSSHK